MSPTPNELRDIARIVRRDVLTMITARPAPATSAGRCPRWTSSTVLYWGAMRVSPDRPQWEDRDRFVLSKAHAAPALYAALARRGYFDVKELLTFRKLKSLLQGFPDMQRTPGHRRVGRIAGAGSVDRERHRDGREEGQEDVPRLLPDGRR